MESSELQSNRLFKKQASQESLPEMFPTSAPPSPGSSGTTTPTLKGDGFPDLDPAELKAALEQAQKLQENMGAKKETAGQAPPRPARPDLDKPPVVPPAIPDRLSSAQKSQLQSAVETTNTTSPVPPPVPPRPGSSASPPAIPARLSEAQKSELQGAAGTTKTTSSVPPPLPSRPSSPTTSATAVAPESSPGSKPLTNVQKLIKQREADALAGLNSGGHGK